jgi:transcriptional regulator with XRE-family HTH domain
MSEITIAARIKMARKMAGLNTQAALLKLIPQWSASRLGNYEAGISMPGPDDVLKIAEATNSSPCWLMFGLGPIRPDHRDQQAIRHQNLSNCYAEIKHDQNAVKRFFKAIKLEQEALDAMLDNPFQPISDELARRFEKHLKYPAGWIDEQHVEHDPLCLSFPDDIRELMTLYSSAKSELRPLMLATLRTLSEHG